MHIWKDIRQLAHRKPVTIDLALEALRPSSPKALLLRIYNSGCLLEERVPTAEEIALIQYGREIPWIHITEDAPGRQGDLPIEFIEYRRAEHHLQNIGEAPWRPEPPRNIKVLRPIESLAPFMSNRSTWAHLYILREELLDLRAELRLESLRAARRARLATAPPVVTRPATAAGKKTTKPKTQLTQGIEKFYLKIRDAGDTIILKPQALEKFLYELRKAVNGSGDCDEVRVHIRKLEKRGGRYRIYVEDPPEVDGKPPKSNEKPGGYSPGAVSKIMTRLRKEFPIE